MKPFHAATIATVIVASAFAAACKPDKLHAGSDPVAQEDSSKSTQSERRPNEMSAHQLDSKYKQGMSYHDFRKMLLADGWRPAADSTECLSISVGENYKDSCAKDGAPDMCGICAEFTEISACTDDGYCYMTFSKGRDELSIKNYGDVLRIRDENSEPVVQEWTMATRHE